MAAQAACSPSSCYFVAMVKIMKEVNDWCLENSARIFILGGWTAWGKGQGLPELGILGGGSSMYGLVWTC